MSEEAKSKRGRPVVENSSRQSRLKSREAKLASGEEISRGRPSNPESKRQARLTARAAKEAAGVVVKPGRPKEKKEDTAAA